MALAAGVSATANAAVDGSPHDLVAQGYLPVGNGVARDKCLVCHLPSLRGDLFPPGQDPPASVSSWSRSGLVCWSCHDGTTIVDRNVDASQSAFHPLSHPLRFDPSAPRIDFAQEKLPVRQGVLECITCHSQHDNTQRPFLRLPTEALCPTCHLGQVGKGYGTDNIAGGHPTHETVEDDAGSATPIEVQDAFRNPYPDGYPLLGGMESEGVHWKRGGHLSAGSEGTIECFTCHAMHGTEARPPRNELLAIDPVRVSADEFCEGCHRGTRGDQAPEGYHPNPGGTTTGRTYHPVDDDISNGKDTFPAVRDTRDFPLGSGAGNPIVCTTCHVAHGGIPKTPALRKPSNAGPFCETCHDPESLPNHHPSGSLLKGARRCRVPEGNASIGETGGGKLTCYSCHVAHNAGLGRREADFVPILRFGTEGNELCEPCHPADNPACIDGAEGTASHFMGDPSLPETYADPDPPVRTDPWPGTLLESRYGGDEAGKTIICLSCHSFRVNPSSGLAAPLPGHLLAHSGNDYEWEETAETYLCTGCHGMNPSTGGEGHTHPMQQADLKGLDGTVQPPATVNPAGQLNCDSCHLPHGASPTGGYYILEGVAGENEDPEAVHPRIDFSVLCHLCHTPGKY